MPCQNPCKNPAFVDCIQLDKSYVIAQLPVKAGEAVKIIWHSWF